MNWRRSAPQIGSDTVILWDFLVRSDKPFGRGAAPFNAAVIQFEAALSGHTLR
jgi:hypothetical protein